jgi:hypothetical protein
VTSIVIAFPDETLAPELCACVHFCEPWIGASDHEQL